MDEIEFASAASYTLNPLGEIFTRCFEGYFYAATVTAAMLSQRIRVENLDLVRSLVVRQGREPAGIALIGLRGERAWCGGFGIAAAARGQGLAHELAAAMLDQARQAGVHEFSLNAEGRAQIADLAAERAEQARTLLAALQQRAQHVVSVNEPADSPLTAAFDDLGFIESDRQHELVIDLV